MTPPERKTNLNNAEACQNKTDRTDKTEDEGGKVIDCGQCAVAIRRKRRYGKAAHNEHNRNHDGAVGAETFLDLALHRQSVSI